MESLAYSGNIFLSKLVGVTDELPTTIMPTETVCVITEELGRILEQHSLKSFAMSHSITLTPITLGLSFILKTLEHVDKPCTVS